MKRIIYAIAAVSLLSGCTYKVSEGITAEGDVSKVIFPNQEDAWVDEGVFPNLENLRNIGKDVTKDDLYYLIGRPHFSEAQGAQEWDYIFKFRQPDGSVEICQYKVIFNDDMRGQQFFWSPASCADNVTPQPVTPPAIVEQPIKQYNYNLGADVMFRFDRFERADILPGGEQKLRELAQTIREHEKEGRVSIIVEGHTDRMGDASYNQQLSARRAYTVRSILANYGIPAYATRAVGYGESQPITDCQLTNKQALANCLQPNRRVEVKVDVFDNK